MTTIVLIDYVLDFRGATMIDVVTTDIGESRFVRGKREGCHCSSESRSAGRCGKDARMGSVIFHLHLFSTVWREGSDASPALKEAAMCQEGC